jgi:hypothetical protein
MAVIGATSPLPLVGADDQRPRDCAGRQWRFNRQYRTFAIGRHQSHSGRCLPLTVAAVDAPLETFAAFKWKVGTG